MARKTYLPEATIQKLELMGDEALSKFLRDLPNAVAQFALLLRSYRIAANVAASAWKLVDGLQKTGQVNPETLAELTTRLRVFAPEVAVFRVPRVWLEHTNHTLQELYNRLSREGATGAVLERIVERMLQYEKEEMR